MGGRGDYDGNRLRGTPEQRAKVMSIWPLLLNIAKLGPRYGLTRDDALSLCWLKALQLARSSRTKWDSPRLPGYVKRGCVGEYIDARKQVHVVDIPREYFGGKFEGRKLADAERAYNLCWLDAQNADGRCLGEDVAAPDLREEQEGRIWVGEVLDRMPAAVAEVVRLRMEGLADGEILEALKIDDASLQTAIAEAGRILAGILVAERQGVPAHRCQEPDEPKIPVEEPPQTLAAVLAHPERYTRAQMAAIAGILPSTLSVRLRSGETLETALDPTPRRRKPASPPKPPTVSQQARERGLKPTTVHERMARGETLEQALDIVPLPTRSPSTARHPGKPLEEALRECEVKYLGAAPTSQPPAPVPMSTRIRRLAEAAGVPFSTVQRRLARGWELERALSLPPRPRRARPAQSDRLPTGEVARLAREHEIPARTLWCRLYELRWTLDRALSTPVGKNGRRRRGGRD